VPGSTRVEILVPMDGIPIVTPPASESPDDSVEMASVGLPLASTNDSVSRASARAASTPKSTAERSSPVCTSIRCAAASATTPG